ncbi:hypothetical protein F8388_005595 [Cannabis sativa]|uniref:phosphopyruvate hydratase n=1 Tax=Cannabis sativa TaxID=3483 RepID=A0A7J6GZ72_CANSA|nr:hypothetical protein F8388_002207 [Cannabis sativa]KAF4387978.1 hypothetical protein F8388_005595 [Cannabis sativa]
MSVQEYLDKHMLSRKIEDAVNAAVRAKTSDPVLFISNHMKKAVPSVITKVKARQILDSRGIPTVEVDLTTNKGMFRASAPSGDSSGMYEAVELRDGDKGLYLGNSVNRAVKNVNEKISEALIGMDPTLQSQIDQAMIDLDKTEKKGELGANAILAVPLYKHIADLSGKTNLTLPVPAFTVISGGKHAGNSLAIQEIMILPIGAIRFEEALQMGSETYQHLKVVITEKYGAHGCNIGENGGFAPDISSIKEGLDLVKEAINRTGYNEKIKIAIDVAATDFCIVVAKQLKEVVGDDLLMSNSKRIERAVNESTCNALLLKINQIGTVTETIEVVKLAKDAQWGVVTSHRCGETEDSFIADLSVGLATGQIKSGAPCRGEQLAKYNQLLRIEEELGDHAIYAGEDWRQ